MRKLELYTCGLKDVWHQQIGELQPRAFAHHIGGCQDLIQRLELYAKLQGHDGCVNTVHFNPAGDLLVSGSDDMEVVFWDWDAKIKRLSFNSGHENNVFQARIMPFSDDRSVVTCAADGQVRHAQILENGRVETRKLAKHRGRAHKLAVEPGSPRTFFSCGEDGVVLHFDLREGKSTKLFTCYGFEGTTKSRRLPIIRLNAIVINPRNPNYFAVGGSDEYARVYDIRKFNTSGSEDYPMDLVTPAHLIGASQVHITCLAYSQQEELLVSYNDELIYLFDKGVGLGPKPVTASELNGTKIESEVYKGHRNAQTVKGVNFFGPNTEYVVSGSDCGHIFIWKKRGAELQSLMMGDSQVVNCLEPHPHATILATSGIDKTIKVWTPTAESIMSLPEDADKIMETNQRRREDRSHISLTPDVIMRILRLQRRSQSNLNQREYTSEYPQDGFEEDDEYMDGGFVFSMNNSSSDEDDEAIPSECVIS